MTKLSKIVISSLVGLIVLVGLVGFYFFKLPPFEFWNRQPVNFEECSKATRGFIMKTLPAKCEFRGELFTDTKEGGGFTTSKISPQLMQKIEKQGRAMVIVTLKGNELTKPENFDQQVKEDEVNRLVNNILSRLKNSDISNVKKFSFMPPSFAGDLTRSGLQKLLSYPEVIHISEDSLNKPF